MADAKAAAEKILEEMKADADAAKSAAEELSAAANEKGALAAIELGTRGELNAKRETTRTIRTDAAAGSARESAQATEAARQESIRREREREEKQAEREAKQQAERTKKDAERRMRAEQGAGKSAMKLLPKNVSDQFAASVEKAAAALQDGAHGGELEHLAGLMNKLASSVNGADSMRRAEIKKLEREIEILANQGRKSGGR